MAVNSGRTKYSFMGSCIRQLWLEVAHNQFELRAVHLPGVDNRLADYLSRWHLGVFYRDSFMASIRGREFMEVVVDDSLFELEDDL